MRIASILLSAGILAALPFSSQAEQRCEHSAARDAALNLSGIKTVIFDIGPHTLALNGTKNQSASLHGKACASDSKRVSELVVSQERSGDKLTVRAQRNGLLRKGSWSGDDYGYLTLTATVPDTLAVRLKLGSGDAVVDGVFSLSADVGSGDLEVRHLQGMFYADVGSGDIQAADIGALHVVSVGSGNLNVRGIRGASQIGEVNSGGLNIANTKGGVQIGSIGSGGATLSGIAGNVKVGSIGAGDLEAHSIDGDLVVDSVGSGSVDHRSVRGQVRIPTDD